VALSFAGVGGREDLRQVMACVQQHGAHWPVRWLRERGCDTEARWWEHKQVTVRRQHDTLQTQEVHDGSLCLDRSPLSDGVLYDR
jgi:hypothetical protein